MKKIICLIESLGSGGAERQLTYLASQLNGKGYEVEVWTYYPNDFYANVLLDAGVKWRYLADAQSKVRRIHVLKQELQKARPDVVIAYLDTCTSVACIIKLLGVKYKLIVSERNTTQKLTLRERLKFFLYRWADFVVPNSYTQSYFIQEHYPYLSNKIYTITNFVDTDKFCPPSEKFENDVPRVLTVARVVPQKNVLRLLEAVKVLKDSGYKFKYDWYGNHTDQEYSQLCRNAISKYGIEDVFTFHEHSKDIVQEYQSSDIFCLPSLYEGFPNVICEAMSCGLPIVCSDIYENKLILSESECYHFLDPLSQNSIIEKFNEILKLNVTELHKRGVVARELCIKKFEGDSFVMSYIDLMD